VDAASPTGNVNEAKVNHATLRNVRRERGGGDEVAGGCGVADRKRARAKGEPRDVAPSRA